jgi:hypothetical protein
VCSDAVATEPAVSGQKNSNEHAATNNGPTHVVSGRSLYGQDIRGRDHVNWNSEAGRVSGRVVRVHTKDVNKATCIALAWTIHSTRSEATKPIILLCTRVKHCGILAADRFVERAIRSGRAYSICAGQEAARPPYGIAGQAGRRYCWRVKGRGIDRTTKPGAQSLLESAVLWRQKHLRSSWEIIDKEIVDRGMFIMGKAIITIPTSCSRVSFACFW